MRDVWVMMIIHMNRISYILSGRLYFLVLDCFPINGGDWLWADTWYRLVIIGYAASYSLLSLIESSRTLFVWWRLFPFVAFSEYTLDAQPLNLNTAFHDEYLISQILTGELLPYFSIFPFDFYCIFISPVFSSLLSNYKPKQKWNFTCVCISNCSVL